MKRTDLWLADLDPVKGHEQSGTRPVIIWQHDLLLRFSSTVLVIPLTSNLRRAKLPTCVRLNQSLTGLKEDSVALCHQLRVLDKGRLLHQIGKLPTELVKELEVCILFTMGIGT